MLVLLTGIPAVGKTSVAEELQSRDPQQFQHFRFARLILQAVRDRRGEPNLSYSNFKNRSAQLVTRADIAVATELLLAAAPRSDRRFLLVDSHAVSKANYGYRATPDSPDMLQRLGYRLIVHLFADPETVIARSSTGEHSQYTSERDVALLEQAQIATSIFYAATGGSQLHIVNANAPVNDVASTVEELLHASQR
jgi:adenylate kinase